MHLIDNWRHLWFRRFSTWLAMLNGLFVAYVFSQPILVIGLLGFAPAEWLIPLAIIAGLLAFGLPVLVAHVAQPVANQKAEAKAEEKRDASQSD